MLKRDEHMWRINRRIKEDKNDEDSLRALERGSVSVGPTYRPPVFAPDAFHGQRRRAFIFIRPLNENGGMWASFTCCHGESKYIDDSVFLFFFPILNERP